MKTEYKSNQWNFVNFVYPSVNFAVKSILPQRTQSTFRKVLKEIKY
jgi:hypothetical protein